MSRWFALLLLMVSPAMAQPVVQGLDHIPIVVRDLEQAASDFEALGFVLKPGRPHANGLRNMHAKFPDGTELELITASTATDKLSRRYVDWLQHGDGPISLGLFAPKSGPAPLDGIFFDKRQKSPTDRPEHFAHPNGAVTLAAAWLAGSSSERQLVELTGIVPLEQPVCAPFTRIARTLQLPEGEIFLLPRLSKRTIVGATVAVASLNAVPRPSARAIFECPRSVWVETHGLWLEFRAR